MYLIKYLSPCSRLISDVARRSLLFSLVNDILFLEFLNLSLPCFLSCSYFLAYSQPGVSYQGCSYKKKRVGNFRCEDDTFRSINIQIHIITIISFPMIYSNIIYQFPHDVSKIWNKVSLSGLPDWLF